MKKQTSPSHENDYSRVRRKELEKKQKNKKEKGNNRQKKKSKTAHIWQGIFFILFSIIILFVGILAGASAYHFNDLFVKIQPENEALSKEVPQFTKKLNNGEPFSLLLIGTDDRIGESSRGRADTIIVATINPEEENVKIISIPRDTLIELPGTPDRIPDKINATYAYGYIPYLRETVEEFLQIPIDAYAIINFEGLISLVDAVGGVYINSDFSFSIKDENSNEIVQIDEGRQLLNGKQALGYARMRKEDPEGDFGRQKRQQEVFEALVDRLLTFDSFSNYTDILKAIEDNLETNVTNEQAQIVFSDYRQVASDIERLSLEGEEIENYYLPHYGLEVFVYDVNSYSQKETQKILQDHLNLEDFVNELNEDYDAFITGFPFHTDDAIDELDLDEYVDREQLEIQQNESSESYHEEKGSPAYPKSYSPDYNQAESSYN